MAENTIKENIETKEAKENKSEKHGISKFLKTVIAECAVLVTALVICRMFVFPVAAKGTDMLHVQIATHAIMIGICSTIFSVVAIAVKRKMKTHKKYIIIPVIFTLFGFLMQKIAEEISVII